MKRELHFVLRSVQARRQRSHPGLDHLQGNSSCSRGCQIGVHTLASRRTLADPPPLPW